MTQPPRPKPQVTDATGRTVAANVRRLRELRGLSTYELARKLKEADRPIAPSALAKVERGERRVDVGDLMALAVVLGVSPTALLLPPNARGEAEVTGAGSVSGYDAWMWAWCQSPLRMPADEDSEEGMRAVREFELVSRPIGLYSQEGDDRLTHWARKSDG
ncbi:helix-turn-helix domain-containing protein [Streptomyces sp. NPDC048604]|uniref:helix-turn-helix domain-containing protein n=1 Tax=Streptomyces sp. NPDC048604 TaxID=3365578 RepID=UPI003720BCCE